MKASQIKPVGNRILVEVVGPWGGDKASSLIHKPSAFDYPQLEVRVLKLGPKISERPTLNFRHLIIGPMAGLDLQTDDNDGKQYKLITPKDILLILE